MDNAATMRSAYERINGGDLDDYAALVAEDFVEHSEIPGLPATKSGMLEYFGMILAAFPDLHFVVDDLIVYRRAASWRAVGSLFSGFAGRT